MQTSLPPVIAPATGKALTITAWIADVAEHEEVLPSVTIYVIFVDPADTGVTTPELSTVAMEVLDEAHVYVKVGVPVACEVNDNEPPMQTAFPPVIAPATGKALMVTVWIADVAEHNVALPSVTVYVIFVDPAATVVTTPELSTVAMAVFDEVQVYVKVGVPVACEVNDNEPPIQTALPPVIAPATGKALTVTAWIADVAEHEEALPSVTVYVIFVDPAVTGVTTPVLLTVATPVFEEVQVYVKVGVPVAFEVNDK
jgi:predicted RNA-binding protein with TRAM domain